MENDQNKEKMQNSQETQTNTQEELEGCCGGGCCGHENRKPDHGCCRDDAEWEKDGCCDGKDCNCEEKGCCSEEGGCACCSDDNENEHALKVHVMELTETLQRLQAEFDNYRKRITREAEKTILSANEDLIKEILPTLDNFELALNSSKEKSEFHKGMELVFAHLYQSLENSGLQIIDAENKKFNPHEHEALLTETSEMEPGTVIEVLQKGYIMNGKVIRHAKVKIAKK